MAQKGWFFLCIIGISGAAIAAMYIPIFYARIIDVITSFTGATKTQIMRQLTIIVIIICGLET
jgi:hypothetical protein